MNKNNRRGCKHKQDEQLKLRFPAYEKELFGKKLLFPKEECESLSAGQDSHKAYLFPKTLSGTFKKEKEMTSLKCEINVYSLCGQEYPNGEI